MLLKFRKRKTGLDKLMLTLTLFVVLVMFFSGCGKPKVPRVGILAGLDYIYAVSEGFKEKMTALGYIEGENIIYDLQRTDFNFEEYERILRKFVADRVDLIFCYPTEAALMAKEIAASSQIPVVFSFVNIEGNDLIDSIREPGGNITGVRYPGPDVAARRFEIMRELFPQAKRFWIPYQKGAPVEFQLEVIYPLAQAAGVELIEAPAADAVELAAVLQAWEETSDLGFDAILFLAEPLTVMPDAFAVLKSFAIKHDIPIGGALVVDGDYGTVFGANVDPFDSGREGAVLADKVLKGAKAGAIPVTSSEIYLQINYKMLQQLGVSASEGLLSQADEIIR